jgi:hypothetical protein
MYLERLFLIKVSPPETFDTVHVHFFLCIEDVTIQRNIRWSGAKETDFGSALSPNSPSGSMEILRLLRRRGLAKGYMQ